MRKAFSLLCCMAAVVLCGCEKDSEPVKAAKAPVVHEFVDLGLTVKWATMNVGACSPQDCGDYFAWGETSPYYKSGCKPGDSQILWKDTKEDGYDWNSYCFGLAEKSMNKYCANSSYGTVDGLSVLELGDDAARVNWGGNWRMPTYAEIEEIRNRSKCTWTWQTSDSIGFGGVPGWKVTSVSNGNFIFLPVTDYFFRNNLLEVGFGYYWSSMLYNSESNKAACLYFSKSSIYPENNKRCYGYCIRPVCE